MASLSSVQDCTCSPGKTELLKLVDLGGFFADITVGQVLQISSVSWFEERYGQLSTLL